MSSTPPLRPATLAVHAPGESPPVGAAGERPHVMPLYQTAAWEAPSAGGIDAIAEGGGYFYARYGAPNADAAAAAIARLEGAAAGACFASGMAALAAMFQTFVPRGGTLVTVRGIYGGTVGLIADFAARGGFRVRWAEAPRPDAIAPLLDDAGPDPMVHVETISNPLLRVADLDGIAALCRARGAFLSVDSTFATPVLCRPIERGADLVMHSATKYLGGHGDVAGGVLCGSRETIARLVPAMRLHGASIDPFAAWLLQRGLRTLHLRVTRQVENARAIALALAADPRVARVRWPGLPSHPDHALCRAQLDGPGAMVAFELASGEAARAAYDRLRLIRRMASLGDVETTMMQPAATSHRGLSPEERARAGIADGLLRISVGIEDPADLVADLVQALG